MTTETAAPDKAPAKKQPAKKPARKEPSVESEPSVPPVTDPAASDAAIDGQPSTVDQPQAGDAPPKPPADAPPKPRGRPAGRKSAKARTRELEDGLAQILSMPAIPFMLAGDTFCAEHFNNAGPQLARDLAAASERNPALRKVLERFLEGESVAVLFMGLTMYALPPILHHNLLPGGAALAPMFGIPLHEQDESAPPAFAENGSA